MKVVISSTNKNDTPIDIADKIRKAVSIIQSQQDSKQFTDPFLKNIKDQADVVVDKILNNMIQEISATLIGDDKVD